MPFTNINRDHPLKGVITADIVRFPDERGRFTPFFNLRELAEMAPDKEFRVFQANLSESVSPKVVRGIHCEQGNKYVFLHKGSLQVNLISVRPDTWGMKMQFVAPTGSMYLVPNGVGHGFSPIDLEGAEIAYLQDFDYNPEDRERNLNPYDPVFDLNWGVGRGQAIMSPEDRRCPLVSSPNSIWREIALRKGF